MSAPGALNPSEQGEWALLVTGRAWGSGSGCFGGPGVAKGWRSGSKAEREKERMSMSQPRTEPESERENEGNVCEGPRHSQETGSEGQSQESGRSAGVWMTEAQKPAEESGMMVRCGETRGHGEWGKHAESACFVSLSGPRLSERLALIVLPFVVKHCVGEIARYALGYLQP